MLDGRGYRLLIANRALSFSAAPVGDAVDDAAARALGPLSLGTINAGKRGTYGKSGKGGLPGRSPECRTGRGCRLSIADRVLSFSAAPSVSLSILRPLCSPRAVPRDD